MSRRKNESPADYKARTKREYQSRKASAKVRGISLSQATGHAKRAKKKSIGDLHLDFRFRAIKEFFFGPRKGQPLPVIGQPSSPQWGPSVAKPPPGVGHVSIFITQHKATAIYPDGRVRVGSIDQVYDEAKRTGLDITVESGNPPKATNVKTKSGVVHDIYESVGNGVYETICDRTVTGNETTDPVTCKQCQRKVR